MSSEGSERKGARRPFETWRKIAIAGALWLLATSILRAFWGEDMPYWLYISLSFVGYMLLVFAFGAFYRSRREKEKP